MFSPVLTVIYSLRNYKQAFAKNVIWAFTVFYGYTFIIFNEGMDSDRYKQWFLTNVASNLSFPEYLATLFSLDNFSTGINLDIFEPILSYLVSQVTEDYRILFAAFGLVVGYFYSRNMWYILERVDFKAKPFLVTLVIAFALIAPIWDLNGFRFCAATHIFLMGTLPFLFEGKKKGLILSVLSIFVHFSFIFPVAVLLLYMLIGNRYFILYIFFISSLFVSEINLDSMNNFISSNFPEVFQVRVSGYISVDRVQELRVDAVSTELNWYVRGHDQIMKWLMIVFISLIFFRGKDFVKQHKNLLRLICFTMLMYGFSNFASLLPSGARFVTLSNFFALAFIILYIQNGPRETVLTKLVPLAVPLLWLFIIVRMRMSLDTFGVSTLLGNPIVIMFFQGDTAIINLIK